MTHFNGKIVNSYSRITRPGIGVGGGRLNFRPLVSFFTIFTGLHPPNAVR